jgi:hypothetical protein
MSSSEGYLLNAIQTPGPLLPVYRSISQGSERKFHIKSDTQIDSGLDSILDGLRLLRMIGKEEEAYYAREYEWDVGDERWNFRLTVLHNLAQECQSNDWGKQAAVLLNYKFLLDKDIQHFENNEEPIYTDIDDWYAEINYRPQSQQGLIMHNDNKFANWTRLVHFLGLVHKVSGREHTVYPDPVLIRYSLDLAAEDSAISIDGTPGIVIEQYLRWLRENLLYVETTSDGAIPEGIARVLFELIRDDEIRIVEYGDAGAVTLGGIPPYDGIDSQANAIKLI